MSDVQREASLSLAKVMVWKSGQASTSVFRSSFLLYRPVCLQILPLPTSFIFLILLDNHIYSSSKNINLYVSVWSACSPDYLSWAQINACFKPLIAVRIQLMYVFTAPADSSYYHHLKTQIGNPTFYNSNPASKKVINVLTTGIANTRKYNSGQFGWPVC